MIDPHWWLLFAALAFLLSDEDGKSTGKAFALGLLAYLLVVNIGTQCFLLGELVK